MGGIAMIDWNKPIETVDGLPARVISTDYKRYDGLPLYVVQIEARHFSHIAYYKEDGNPHATCDRIRNVRVKREGWALVRREHGAPVFSSDWVYASKKAAEEDRELKGGIPAFVTWEE
jgi:hypothetical protein